MLYIASINVQMRLETRRPIVLRLKYSSCIANLLIIVWILSSSSTGVPIIVFSSFCSMQLCQITACSVLSTIDKHAVTHNSQFLSCAAYVGLPSFPGHTRAAAQQEGFGAMMSFTVRGGEAAAKALCVSLRLITHATSLGGVESLLERRAQYPSDASRGSPANLLRMSVGLEHIEDIWADLAQALEASQEHAASGSDA